MPAPAVIPAPKAYINAAAVKGFVVELWLANPLPRPLLWGRQRSLAVNIRNTKHGNGSFPLSHVMHAGKAPVIFTVTKKSATKAVVRPVFSSMG